MENAGGICRLVASDVQGVIIGWRCEKMQKIHHLLKGGETCQCNRLGNLSGRVRNINNSDKTHAFKKINLLKVPIPLWHKPFVAANIAMAKVTNELVDFFAGAK